MNMRSALLIHGAGGGGWEWNAWRGVLEANGLRASSPDLRPGPDGLPATRLADYLAQMLAALAAVPRPRVAIGASLGGLLALQLAADADALVLVNPIPPAPWHSGLPPRAWPPRVRWRADSRLAATRRSLPDADPATALYAFRRWRDESGRVMEAAYAGVEVAVPAIPILCIASGEDTDVPCALTQALASHLQADLLTLPGVSHVGPLLGRDAAAVAAQVCAWLSQR